MDTILPSSKRALPLTGTKTSYRGLGFVFTVALAAWVGAGAIGVAQADRGKQVPAAESVSHRDLDLSTEAGAREMLVRIDRAAQRICGPEPVNSPLTPRANVFHDRCVAGAVTEAVAKINAPVVTALHTGSPSPGGATLAAR